ncbi:peptide synthetase [Aeromicrobium sp. 636]|uniref:Peptide synthetase n=1 Tax=Aeromicrobium senzhongii TaxID=2663859 RepID=A0A8I0EUB0_9ACTN|nr:MULTISPECIES: condensation domain-containing protein [Aeromicrobium]MBC9225476.1 peptide synthetase [Aeromicrobium senzhongii]MCQ3997586.1 peptide synthetase [Aeromicrobium sp. 636]
MRLTHVAHLRLPFGPLLSHDLTFSAPGAPLPVSFDQARHVGAGDRAGSWMALAMRLDAPVAREDLAAAWRAVVASHGTLRSVFVPGDDATPALHEVTVGDGGWTEHEVRPGQAMNDALHAVLDAGCRPYSQPSHRFCVIETADGPTLVVAADHAHVDMWSMLVIARDVLAALDQCRQGVAPTPRQVPTFAEHTVALQQRSPAPPEIHRRWAEVIEAGGGAMPRFPLPLGDPAPQPERVVIRDVLDLDSLAAFSARAAAEKATTLALAVSAMTSTTRELAGTALRTVFPVHSRYEQRWHDSVGWFITNAVLESEDPDPRACADAVREAIRLGSWPLAELMAPWGGMPEAPGMFAVSWLDMRRLPVRIDTAGLDAQYVSAAISTHGVMLWFIIDDSGVHLRCRYPDTATARRNVGAWLDALVARMRALATGASPGPGAAVEPRPARMGA